MTKNQINGLVAGMAQQIGCPYAFYAWPAQDLQNPAPAPPYILFYYNDRTDEYFDNINYLKKALLTVEFYADNVTFPAESVIEDVFTEDELPFEAVRTYIESEKLWLTSYETEVTINA